MLSEFIFIYRKDFFLADGKVRARENVFPRKNYNARMMALSAGKIYHIAAGERQKKGYLELKIKGGQKIKGKRGNFFFMATNRPEKNCGKNEFACFRLNRGISTVLELCR